MLHSDPTGVSLLRGGGVEGGRFHNDCVVLWLHDNSSVDGGRFHGDGPDLGDGSVEGGRFHDDSLDPANVWVHRAIPRDAATEPSPGMQQCNPILGPIVFPHRHPPPPPLGFHRRCRNGRTPLPPGWAFQ
jgi:hypothetical protein